MEGGNRIGIREDSKTFWAVGEKQRIHDKKNGGRQGQEEGLSENGATASLAQTGDSHSFRNNRRLSESETETGPRRFPQRTQKWAWEGPTRLHLSWEWERLGMLDAATAFSCVSICVSLKQVQVGKVSNISNRSQSFHVLLCCGSPAQSRVRTPAQPRGGPEQALEARDTNGRVLSRENALGGEGTGTAAHGSYQPTFSLQAEAQLDIGSLSLACEPCECIMLDDFLLWISLGPQDAQL